MLKLGENLKKLRVQRELTQEQLSDILGVSAQAISRWENGTTYPDITLLPVIANYFEITLDELMGMDAFKSVEQLKELTVKLVENGNKGLIYENILLLRDAVKSYPTDYQLQLRLVNQLTFCQYKDGHGLTDEEEKELKHEAVQIGERILSRCTDGEIINKTTRELAYIYFKLGDSEKAVEYAKKLPNIGFTSTVVLGDILDGKEQKKHLQQGVKHYVCAFWNNLRNMADIEFKDETMSTDERIAIMQKALALFSLVYEDGDYLDYSCTLSTTHHIIADLSMHKCDYELALSSLEKAAEYAIMSDLQPSKALHTSLLLRGLECDTTCIMKNFESTECKVLYKIMQTDKYDAIRENERFIAVLNKLKEYC